MTLRSTSLQINKTLIKPSLLPLLSRTRAPGSDRSLHFWPGLIGCGASEVTCSGATSTAPPLLQMTKLGSQAKSLTFSTSCGNPMLVFSQRTAVIPPFTSRLLTTVASPSQDSSTSATDVAPRIKFKRLDKTAGHIMKILDKEAVEEVKTQREIPDIQPGYIVQLKVEVPENKRRLSLIKGIVIARRNAGLNTTFRIRRLVAGVGVETLLHLYSPNIKEIKVLDKKNVRRAKLYYLRERMNPLKNK